MTQLVMSNEMGSEKFMQMLARKWLASEDGAITVDWVVITAMVVLLGAGAGLAIGTATLGHSTDVTSYLNDIEPGSLN